MKESILDVHLEKCRAKSNLLRMLTLLLLHYAQRLYLLNRKISGELL